MKCTIEKRMNIRWRNYLNHLLNLLLICGNAYSSTSDNGGNVLTFNSVMSGISYNKSISTSISSSNVTNKANFTTSNFTALSYDKSRNHIKNSNVLLDNEEEVQNGDGTGTYHKTNFNGSNKSSFSKDILRLINDSRKRDKRGGPKSVRSQMEMKTIVNTTKSIIINDDSDVKSIQFDVSHSEFTPNHNILFKKSNQSYRVSRAPQNAKRKKLKSITDIPTPITTTATTTNLFQKPVKVSLLGLFELTSRMGVRAEGKSELAAAELAVKHINERELLKGYTLELVTNDTQVRNTSLICNLYSFFFVSPI